MRRVRRHSGRWPRFRDSVSWTRGNRDKLWSMSQRVVVAMSGGVDSSVAAARLVAQGFDVIGVTLHLWDYPDDGSVRGRCCAPEDIFDARRVADRLGIAHYTYDRREL